MNPAHVHKRRSTPRWSLVTIFALIVALLGAAAAQAAPPPGKGGGKGGGGGGSTPTPEQHFEWRVAMPGSYSLVRPALATDGTVYSVDVNDNLYAVDPDGTVLWTAAEAGSKGVDVGPDGTIYTGNENWIKAFRPDGTLKWTFVQSPRAFVFIDVVVGPDANIYAVASSGMGVFSLADMGDRAELRWQTPEAYTRNFVGYTEIEFGPTMDGNDQQLYFFANGHTRAVRISDGANVFTLGGGNTIPRVSPVDGSWHRPATAHAPDGSTIWEFEYPLATGTTEPAIGTSGGHYAVNSGRVLYAIDANGNERFHSDLGEYLGLPDVDPTETLVLLPASGAGTSDPAALLAVDARNGSTAWRMEFPASETGLDQFVGSHAAFTPDGATAYVMTATLGGGHAYLNAVTLDASLPSASTILRSSDVNLSGKTRRGSVNVTGNVVVLDQNHNTVSGASVDATWTLPDGTEIAATATSSGSGTAKFSLSGQRGLYQLTVEDITLTGYTFDPVHSTLTGGRYL